MICENAKRFVLEVMLVIKGSVRNEVNQCCGVCIFPFLCFVLSFVTEDLLRNTAVDFAGRSVEFDCRTYRITYTEIRKIIVIAF
jgi:hypothetical protein